MNIGAVLVGIGLLIGVAAFVARPLLERSSSVSLERADAAPTRAQLTAQRDAIYALIRELDADHLTGKVNDEDYQKMRERYVAEGVSILKELDSLPPEHSQAGLEAEIEARVLALRATRPKHAPGGQPYADRFCTQCGQPVDPENRFCAQCGAQLKGVAAQ
jgi:hypothetical protein